jgi:hypothetical protein
VANLSPREYDQLERAVQDGKRIAVVRQGRETVVMPRRIFVREGREILQATHPTTGDVLDLVIDFVDSLEILP